MSFNKKLVLKRVSILIFILVVFFSNFILNSNIKIKTTINEDLFKDNNPTTNNNDNNIFKLIFGTSSGPYTLDPQDSWETSSFNVFDQVCEGLFTYNLSDSKLQIIPRLATSKGTWMINSTDTWYTVSLRPNVFFHDGTKFNATAVKFTFDRLSYFMNLTGTLPGDVAISVITQLYEYYDPDLDQNFPIINDTVIIDEYTIRFELNKPYGPFEALLCFPASYILSPTSTPQFEYINITTGDLIGTGPFVYDHYLPDIEVKFHAFDNYWAGKANITILKFSIIQNAVERNNALLSGEVDLLIDPLISMYEDFDLDPDITLVDAGQTTSISYLGMNNQKINVTLRKAISYAINYSYIIDELYYEGYAARLKSPLPENFLFANWSFNVANYNVTHARMIMQSMGFGLGWDTAYPGSNEAQWSAASFRTYNYTYNIGNQLREDIFDLLQNNLDKIGIEVTDAGMDFSEYLYRLLEVSGLTRNMLELFWFGWIHDYNDPSNYINSLLTNRSIAYNSAQYDGYSAAIQSGRDQFDLWDNTQLLMEAALFETNQNIRKQYYDRIQQLLVEEDMPWAFGLVPDNFDAYRSHIIGFQSNAMGILNFYGVTQNGAIAPQTIYLDGNQEWQYFKNAGKCTGQGTISDPYVIEDLIIDGRNKSASCIFIENSDVYFRIENCTLFNSIAAGIKLMNASNGEISGNNCSNNGVGIHLDSLNLLLIYNISIIGNFIYNNSQYGLILNNVSNTLVFNNNFTANNINAFDNWTSNAWDNGTFGNYWDDYGGADANDDGIGDIPYAIPGTAGSQDNFPIWNDGIDQGDNIFKLVFGTDYGISDLDPHVAWDSASIDVIDQVCEGLFKYNLLNPNFPVIPNLASSFGSWMINSTDTWYTVPLRSDVTFHDGTKFNASAVKFSFDRLAYFINNSMASAEELYKYYDPDLGMYIPIINKTVIINEYTIRFELNKPYGVFEHLLCFSGSYILSPLSTPQFEVINTNTGDLVGTGPFVYDYYLPDNEIKFHAFDNYWAGRANITILKFSIIPDSIARNNALLSGEIDLLVDPLTSMFSVFDADPDITLFNAGQNMIIQYLGINNNMINSTWRKAISYSINYSYIIDELYGGHAVRLKSPIPENMPYANWSFDVAIYNVTKAREIMQSLGYGLGWDTAYPGTNEAQWSAASFRTFNYTYNIGSQLRENILLLLQNNLDKIGIEVTDAGMTWTEFVYRMYEASTYTRDMLELFWSGWGPDYCDPSNYINPHFTNRSIASNAVQYNGYTAAIEAGRDPFDAWDNVQLLMEAAIFETDPSARKVYYERIQQLLVEEDMPWAFGFVGDNYDAYRSHILGFQSNSMGKLSFYGVTQDSNIAPQTIYLDGNQEWLYFKNAGKCTGQGIISDPYRIADLIINGRNESVSCILIENSDVHFRIVNCTLFNSNIAGIKLINASNGEIIGNNFSNNSVGIHLDNFNLLIIDNTNIMGNFIYNNSQYGLILNNVSNTLVFDNNFTANNVNAFDNWTSNAWDNGTFGNYWDDYGGVDANDDGIGDTPYLIPGTAGSQDNFPIWDDGIGIIAAKIDNIILNGQNKTIDKSISLYYNELLEIIITYRENLTSNFINAATVNITGPTITAFFVENAPAEYYILTLNTSDLMIGINDLEINAYKVNYTQVSTNITVTVFASNLSMYIVSPSAGQLFGAMAPTYNVEISGTNLDTMWYTLDGGLTNITFISNGTIYQTEWDKLVNGTATIIFYANDTLGNVISNSVTVRKDIVTPFITINSPGNNTYWNTPPTINIIAFDSNLDTIWYTVGTTNVMITNNTDILLDASIWVSLPDESVFQMSIFANDTVGNLNNTYILSLYKDIKIPTITNVNSTKANGTYTIGEVILIEVIFSELVYVTGTPQLTLETGSVDAIVNYTNGSGTTILAFTYTVAPGHISPDLDYISTNALSLNGGTIKDIVGNDADLTLSSPGSSGSLGYNKDIIINTIAPTILINAPTSDSLFGYSSPDYNVEITDINGIDTMWYTLDGGLINITFITNGTINQIEWDKQGNGTVTIVFYANDTLGNLASNSVTVRKDIIAPVIIINSPFANDLFGSLAPSFIVEINDNSGIDTMWYTLDGGITNIAFIINGTIDQGEWNKHVNGTITITFYANDTIGNLAFTSIVVRKDIIAPEINITTPLPNELFGPLTPSFTVEISDSSGIDTMWYTLDGGSTNITFITNGSIDQNEWDNQINGTVTITFYANDTVGNLASNSVVVRKDVEVPNINITSPLPNEYFGSFSPNYTVEITDINGIDTMWYTLDGGLTNITFITNGTIDQSEWNKYVNGIVTIIFYANDTIGNLASNSVAVRKDTEVPNINITSPLPNDLFGSSAPSFIVEITDISGIDIMWYTLDGGLTNITFIINGTIDQTEWDAQGNGTVTITFYANDSLGNLASNSIVLRKDVIAPDIIITSPLPNELFGPLAPSFTVEINDSNGIDTMWYTLDGGSTNITLISNGTIDQSEWVNQLNGTVTIIFYANDTVGNLASNSVAVRKDVIAPDIIITSPLPNDLFGSSAPSFTVEITDINGIDIMWYTLDGGLTNITFITNGTIDQTEWEAQGNGTVTIIFYANDTVGNLASNSVIVRKDIEVPSINIISPLPNELFGSLSPSYIVEITDINGIATMWYTLDGGSTNFTFVTNGTIDQSEWDNQINGTVTITFYSNDSLGNLASNSILLRKDVIAPDIIITSPLPNELFGSLLPSFTVEINDINGIDTMWYMLVGGLTNITFITNGTIDQSEWDNQINGTVTITFYANDTVGNLASNSVVVRKDIEVPDIIITSPLPNELFGSLSPSYTVEITDINGIATMWYTLDGGLTNITFITNGTIDQTEWNAQGNGTITIIFYANDSIGNLASNSVVVRKDIEVPNINIASPLPDELFGSLSPSYTVEITDINGIATMWYTLDGGLTNITFITNGTIDQTEWDGRINGTVTITFYANDSIGNLAYNSVVVQKDIEVPNINITSPLQNELFGSLSPSYVVDITDINGIDIMWYTLDGGFTNITFITNGTIDQTEWDGRLNGTITITFYANDTLGNLASNSVVVRKDILSGPTILINTPIPNSIFGYSPPNFIVEITDINGIGTMWYTLDGGFTNITFITNGTIDQTEWDGRINGTVTITFYANDSIGNLANNSVVVRKDIEIPNINIISPLPNDLFGPLAPFFTVEITDINGIGTMWYTLDGGLTNITFITNGTIDQSEWDAQGNGTVTIIFFANDSIGNLANNSVVIRKDIQLPSIIINSPIPNELFGTLAPTFNVIITAINGIDIMWYTIDGGSTNITFITNGTIDQSEWDAQGNGTVTITFYANDTLGNLASNPIVVRKDILSAPTILINTPIPNSIFGYSSPNFNVEITNINGIDTMWYTLDGGFKNITFITNGTIDQTEWDAQGNGTVTITFYANNTLGFLSFMDITVGKDIEIPVITIHHPILNEEFQLSSPEFNLSIIEGNLDLIWYFLSNNTFVTGNFTFNCLTGKIDQGLWDSFYSGQINIHFYAIDIVGNIGFQNVTIRKLPEYYFIQSTIIDETGAGNYTWDEAKAQEWCYGTGTWNDPYVIEFLAINGHNAGSNLIIRNSSAFFIIRYSILYNSGGGANDAGLKLEHVSNAILINLDCSNNNGHGLYLYDCENITILESNMNYNKLAGIFLNQCRYISILNNTETISYNFWAIYLFMSHSNIIGGSVLAFNQIGIFFKQSNNNLIINNFLNQNDDAYIEEDSYGNTFQGNTVVSKPDYLFVIIITVISIVSISGVSFVVVRKKVIIPKKRREIKVYDKKKMKIEEKLQNRLLTVDHLIEEKSVKDALKDLEEIKDLCKIYGLFEMLKECDEKAADCNYIYLEMINLIKRIVLNLATKFSRLEITNISEQTGISDEDFIIEVLQEMIQNNEINGEYFSKSKAVAFDKQSNIKQIEQFIKIYREWELLNLERDDSELLLEEIRSKELKPKTIVSKLLPKRYKKRNIFLSYSIIDADYFEISRVAKSLEEFPEIDKVIYWESDRAQETTDYREFMDKTLKDYDVFVLFCSKNSRKSASVKDEWQVAFEKRTKSLISMIPVYEKLDDIPVILGHLLNVKYDKKEYNNFIKNLYQEIMRSRSNKISQIIA